MRAEVCTAYGGCLLTDCFPRSCQAAWIVAGLCLAGLKEAVQPMDCMACPTLTRPGIQVANAEELRHLPQAHGLTTKRWKLGRRAGKMTRMFFTMALRHSHRDSEEAKKFLLSGFMSVPSARLRHRLMATNTMLAMRPTAAWTTLGDVRQPAACAKL